MIQWLAECGNLHEAVETKRHGPSKARSTCLGLKAAWELLSQMRSGDVAIAAWSQMRSEDVTKAAWSQRKSGNVAKAAWSQRSGDVAKVAWSQRRSGDVAKAAWSQRRSVDVVSAAGSVSLISPQVTSPFSEPTYPSHEYGKDPPPSLFT